MTACAERRWACVLELAWTMLDNSLLSFAFLVTLFEAGTWQDLLLWQAKTFKSPPMPCSMPMNSRQAAVYNCMGSLKLSTHSA